MTEVIYETSIFEEAYQEYKEAVYETLEYFKERYGEFEMDQASHDVVKHAAEASGIKIKEVIYSSVFEAKNKDWVIIALVEGEQED